MEELLTNPLQKKGLGGSSLVAAEKALNAQFAKELEMASFGGDAANGGEDDTSMKTGNSTSSKKKIKRVNDAGLGGHPIVKQLLHKKSSKAHTQGGTTQSLELKIEDLDEAQLKKRFVISLPFIVLSFFHCKTHFLL